MTDKNTQAQAAKQTAASVEANSNLKVPSAGEIAKAQTEGIKDAVKENAKDTYNALTDGNLPGAPAARQWHGKDDIMQYAGMLDLGVDDFAQRIEKAGPVPEEKVAGLLELERSGQNRTDYVRAMCKRLGVKSPYEVTNAGPDYTNDVTPITKL